MTSVVQNIQCFASCQKQLKGWPSGNPQHALVKRHVSVNAGEWDSSQAGSFVASTLQSQNSTPSVSLNNV